MRHCSDMLAVVLNQHCVVLLETAIGGSAQLELKESIRTVKLKAHDLLANPAQVLRTLLAWTTRTMDM